MVGIVRDPRRLARVHHRNQRRQQPLPERGRQQVQRRANAAHRFYAPTTGTFEDRGHHAVLAVSTWRLRIKELFEESAIPPTRSNTKQDQCGALKHHKQTNNKGDFQAYLEGCDAGKHLTRAWKRDCSASGSAGAQNERMRDAKAKRTTPRALPTSMNCGTCQNTDNSTICGGLVVVHTLGPMNLPSFASVRRQSSTTAAESRARPTNEPRMNEIRGVACTRGNSNLRQ